MIKKELASLLATAAIEAQKQHLLPEFSLPEIELQHPQNPEHGDFASNLALRLARAARMSPLSIAKTLAGLVPKGEKLARVETAPPGFINFTLNSAWLARQIDAILDAGEAFGNSNLGQGKTAQVEFVSANPTGPLHVGGGRGAVLGDTLANVLTAAGYQVQREYYINDAGNQMAAFYQTLAARYLQHFGHQIEVPPEGYAGSYMIDLAKEIAAEHGNRFVAEAWQCLNDPQGPSALGELGVQLMLKAIREDLSLLGVTFDRWYSERSLFSNGIFEQAMGLLQEKGYLEEREGARWFVSNAPSASLRIDLNESKDNRVLEPKNRVPSEVEGVVVRSNGIPTYFASDIAYHYDKFALRGFDRVIDIWGADHQGHVPRMKAMMQALGFDPDRLQIIIMQLVSLRRGEQIVRVSKRTGDIITLREVIEEVGSDACRFFFLSRSADGQMDFDLELAKTQAPENPVYYVQYAHARIASILRNAQEKGFSSEGGDVALLSSEPELTLIRKMLLLPELIELAAMNLEPHHLPHYAQDLATAFHSFYKLCRVLNEEDEALSKARLKLVLAAKIVLAKTLHLMGMTAPERM